MVKMVKNGTTMIMVAYNEEITRIADRLARMRNGCMHKIPVNHHHAQAANLVW